MTNFETGTRNTMMWRVPWATATGGHTDQIVEMLDVYPCADPSQAPSALDGEGSTIFGGSKGRAIVLPGRSSSSRVSRRCLRATAWTPSRRLTASTASPMPRPSVSAAHRSVTSPSCSGPVSTASKTRARIPALALRVLTDGDYASPKPPATKTPLVGRGTMAYALRNRRWRCAHLGPAPSIYLRDIVSYGR